MSKSGRKITSKKQENPKRDLGEFSDHEGFSGEGGAKTSSLYTSLPSGSRKWEPQESTLASSNEKRRKNEKLKKWIADIEADLSELKQEFNLEETSSGQYANWRRKNPLYIDGILFVVLAVIVAWYIAGIFSGNSPVSDRPIPGIDRICEKKIQALESRFDGEIQDLKHHLNLDISNFRNIEFASISSEFDFIKREYDGLKSNTEHRMYEIQTNMAGLTEGNDEFKTKQNQALEDFKTQQAETLEQSKTKLESDKKTFEENLEESIREKQSRKIQEIEDGVGDKVNEKIDGKSDNLTRHIVAIVFEREEFVKMSGAFVSLKGEVHTLSEKFHHQDNKTQELLNEVNMAFDGRLTKVEQNLSASIKSTKDECMEEIKKVNNDVVQNLTDSVKSIGGEIGNVRDLVQNANETLVEKIINIDEEIQTLHIQMREKITAQDSQLEIIQEMLNKSTEETAGKTQERMNEVQTNTTSMMKENDKFKIKQSQALEDFRTLKVEFLEGDQKTFKENVEESIREEQSQIQETGNGDKVNKKIDDTVVMLVVAIIVFIVILVMIMMRQTNIAVQKAVGGSRAMQDSQDHVNKLLKTVQGDCAKEKTVCILYFSKQSKDLCMNLTKTVEPDTQKHTTYYLDNTRDIPNMPRSKVIIIYVEKNERNVILECPYQEIGDLRRLTVVAARKMGATVVVVYMHHEESRNLGKEELYCSTLYSVRIHSVLSELEKEGAVLSVFDSFSDFQQKHLKDLLLKSIV